MKKIFLCIVCALMAISGFVASYAVSYDKNSIAKVVSYYDLGDQKVKIDIYQREVGEPDDSPTFAVGDTIMKAINYKKANLTEDVAINFAIYRVYFDTAFYYVPNSINYGKMTSLSSNETKDCIRFTYAMVKAAQWGIETNFLFHTDNDKTLPYMENFMDLTCFHDSSKKVSDYLTVKQCQWPLNVNSSAYQMHSKQFMVTDYIDHDGTEHHNEDDHRQSGY